MRLSIILQAVFKPVRPFKERNRIYLNAWKSKRLVLSERTDRPSQFRLRDEPPEPKILTQERKLPSLQESRLPYTKYSDEAKNQIETHGTFYDPLFNPHLLEERHRVDPNEEPFNAIYVDSTSEGAKDYTSVRNITSPELWSHVENLARLKVAPQPRRRKADEPVRSLPSGFVPPPETPPDLPYFIPRTRNYLLPVYYWLDKDPDNCCTLVRQASGDLWKLEEDLRCHLESLLENKRRILTSVQETDAVVSFRGRYVHEIVNWLHAQGF